MPTLEATLPKTKLTHCPLCGELLADPNECSKCDWVKGYGETTPEAGLIKPRDLVASLLGLAVPGLGHVYKGQTMTGVIFLLGAAMVSFFALIFLAFVFPIPASPIILALYWGFVCFQGYWTKDYFPKPEDIWGKMAAMVLAGVLGAMLTVFAAFHFLHSVS